MVSCFDLVLPRLNAETCCPSRIRTESSAVDGLLQAAEGVARRLESSWQNLEASFSRTSNKLHR